MESTSGRILALEKGGNGCRKRIGLWLLESKKGSKDATNSDRTHISRSNVPLTRQKPMRLTVDKGEGGLLWLD